MAMETKTHLLEVLQTEILARLPLRSICRFKSVCKTWKSTIESVYFRRLFLSLHGDSSPSSWSLMCGQDELIFFHGRKTWDLSKAPASLISPSFRRYYIGDCDYRDSSGGLVLVTDRSEYLIKLTAIWGIQFHINRLKSLHFPLIIKVILPYLVKWLAWTRTVSFWALKWLG